MAELMYKDSGGMSSADKQEFIPHPWLKSMFLFLI